MRRKHFWWNFIQRGYHRFWTFPDWYQKAIATHVHFSGVMRLVSNNCHGVLTTILTASNFRSFGHLSVCQKCAWIIGYNGIRVGEAKNPGPKLVEQDNPQIDVNNLLDIGCFNPTQLYGKEESIIQWGRGIYCASETSATLVAQRLTRNTFRKSGFNIVFSEPVLAQRPSISQIRGRASGTAIISNYPMRPFWEPMTQPIADTHRAVDTVWFRYIPMWYYMLLAYMVYHT